MDPATPTGPSKRATTFQFVVGFSVGLSAMASGAWLAWPAIAIKQLLDGKMGFNVTRSEISIMVAIMDFGNMITPIPSSYFMNWIGRIATLWITALLYIFSSIFCIWAQNMYFLYAARLSAGLAKGITFTVVPIFLAEVASIQIRGALSTMFIGFLNFGSFYDYFLGAFMKYEDLNIANLVITIIFILTFIFVPESPYYLVTKQKFEKAKNSLAKYRKIKKEDDNFVNEMEIIRMTVERDMRNKEQTKFRDVIGTPSNRRALLIVVLLAWFQRSTGISPTLAYSTITLPETGGGFSREIYMIIFSFVYTVGNYFATPLIDVWGRRRLLIMSSLSTAAVQGLAGLFYFLDYNGVDVSSYRWVPYMCIVMFGFTYALGIGFIPSTLVGELFPTNVKTYAGSISAIVLAATSFCINRAFQQVGDWVGVHYMYLYFTVCSILCAVYTYFCVLETNRKTFLQIQNELRNMT